MRSYQSLDFKAKIEAVRAWSSFTNFKLLFL
jgi:hypothetical protein